jgi:hypothetical protein
VEFSVFCLPSPRLGLVSSRFLLAINLGIDCVHLAKTKVRRTSIGPISHLGDDSDLSKLYDSAIECALFVIWELLTPLFSTGLGVDIAIGFIAIEFLFLLWQSKALHRSKTAIGLLLALGPGVCLMLALRCALTGTGVGWIAFWLTASLPLHLADVLRRRF